jgi:hypothetical protein
MVLLLQPDVDLGIGLEHLALSAVTLAILIACSFDQPPVLWHHVERYFNHLIHHIVL